MIIYHQTTVRHIDKRLNALKCEPVESFKLDFRKAGKFYMENDTCCCLMRLIMSLEKKRAENFARDFVLYNKFSWHLLFPELSKMAKLLFVLLHYMHAESENLWEASFGHCKLSETFSFC